MKYQEYKHTFLGCTFSDSFGPSVSGLGQRSAQSLKTVCVGKAQNTSKQHKTDEDSKMAGEVGRGSTGKENISAQRTTGRDRERDNQKRG